MIPARTAAWLSVALLLASCSRSDPFDNPEYAAACHGPPLRTIEARQQAQEDGYHIDRQFDCIDKHSWAETQKYQAEATRLRAARAAVDAAPRIAPSVLSLAEAREGFVTRITASASGTALPEPPPALFVRSDYLAAEGRQLAAFVTPDPKDGQRHAAIVWLTGGDSSTLGDFWTTGSAADDQSASVYREAGIVMMFPTLRGGNVDTGKREFFLGETDDVHAAANHLARLPYVDPARVYLGGHSTGGTLALLAAETGGRFAAVFAFGAVGEVSRYPAAMFPAEPGAADEREFRLRSPLHWLDAISTPVYLIEGTDAPGNAGALETLCAETRNPQVHCIAVRGRDHFSVLDAVGRVLAPRLAGVPPDAPLLSAAEFAAAAPSP